AEEVQMEVAATELTVSDGADADFFLFAHGGGDGLVLELAQRGVIQFTAGMAVAGGKQGGGAQQAAHLVGTGEGSSAHGKSLRYSVGRSVRMLAMPARQKK